MSQRNLIIFEDISERTAKLFTTSYSTSFSKSIAFLNPRMRQHIYNIYGFVRLADEIVDSFNKQDREEMLEKFEAEYAQAKIRNHSINPIIHAFLRTKNKFQIEDHLVESFLESMRMDLGNMSTLDESLYQKYIYGSAEVVGLMCLHVFVDGDSAQYEKLKPAAQHFGAALQKINFLRDFSSDFYHLERLYFPYVDFRNFSEQDKKKIEKDIENDLHIAITGIRKLPRGAIVAVYLAYRYFNQLFLQIKKTEAKCLLQNRLRVTDYKKSLLVFKVFLRGNLNRI